MSDQLRETTSVKLVNQPINYLPFIFAD